MTKKQKFFRWLATQEGVTLPVDKMNGVTSYAMSREQAATAILRASGMLDSEATYKAKKLVSMYEAEDA